MSTPTAVASPETSPALDPELELGTPLGKDLSVWRRFLKATARVAVLMASDIAFLAAAFYLVHHGDGRPLPAEHPAFLVAVVLAGVVAGSYGAGRRRWDPSRIVATATLATVLVLYHALWTVGVAEAFRWLLPLWFPAVAGVAASRFLVHRTLKVWRPSLATTRALVLLGERPPWTPEPGERGTDHLHIVGVVDDLEEHGGQEELTVPSLARRLREVRADTLLVSGMLTDMTFATVLDTSLSTGARLLTMPRTPSIPRMVPAFVWVDDRPVLELVPPALSPSQLAAKRVVDVLGSAILITLLAPLLLCIAGWVKATSKGPVFFRHRRLGKSGEPFGCIKFRTMRPDADELLRQDADLFRSYVAHGFKLPLGRDPRITYFGRVLRRTSLDELPQLFNVLKGDMSLVGPRPIVPEEIAHFPHREQLLLSVKPGVTGLWAISGRSDVGYPDRALIELEYVRQWGLWEDVRILLLTIPRVLTSAGAH